MITLRDIRKKLITEAIEIAIKTMRTIALLLVIVIAIGLIGICVLINDVFGYNSLSSGYNSLSSIDVDVMIYIQDPIACDVNYDDSCDALYVVNCNTLYVCCFCVRACVWNAEKNLTVGEGVLVPANASFVKPINIMNTSVLEAA